MPNYEFDKGFSLYNTFSKADVGYFLIWNDHPPDLKSKSGKAHSKGVIYYDEKKD